MVRGRSIWITTPTYKKWPGENPGHSGDQIDLLVSSPANRRRRILIKFTLSLYTENITISFVTSCFGFISGICNDRSG